MTTPSDHPNHEPSPANGLDGLLPPMSDADLLRVAADGELDVLDEAQRRRVELLLETESAAAAFVAAERRLRGSVARAMGSAGAPAGLREAVRERIAASAPGVAPRAARAAGPLSWIAISSSMSRWGGLALAATLVVGASVLLLTLASRVGDLPQMPAVTPEQVAYRNRLVGFVAGEHRRCGDEGAQLEKFQLDPDADLPLAVSQALGVAVDLPPCTTLGLRLIGTAPCHVPGGSPSAHVMFQRSDVPESEDAMVSLFVRLDGEELPLAEDERYRIDGEACSAGPCTVYAWRRKGVLFLLVTSSADRAVCIEWLNAFSPQS